MLVVIVPTIRKDYYKHFVGVWEYLFNTHNAVLIPVYDGKTPKVTDKLITPKRLMGKYADLIYNFNSGVRNLGIAYAYKQYPDADYFMTLDDDVFPLKDHYYQNDPIREHFEALKRREPVSWVSTASSYMRGFPYNVRTEAEIVLSHGVWEGIKDWDAPTQLVKGNKDVMFYKGVIPKGVYYPMCSMNLMWKRKATLFMYQAPMNTHGLNRFEDIWCGITSKREFDKRGWGVVTGYSKVYHSRASNVFANLQREAKGIGLNETFWSGDESDPYFKLYNRQRKRWVEYLQK